MLFSISYLVRIQYVKGAPKCYRPIIWLRYSIWKRTWWSSGSFIELLGTITPTDSTRPGESHIQGVERCSLTITASPLEVLLETIHRAMDPFFLSLRTERRLASVHTWRRKLLPVIVNFPDADNFSEPGIQVILTENSSLENGSTRRNWLNLLSSKGTHSPNSRPNLSHTRFELDVNKMCETYFN